MNKDQFDQVQKIIEKIKECERQIKLLPPTQEGCWTFRSFLKRVGRRVQCWKEDSWSNYYQFTLTDEDVALLIKERQERIRLYKSQLQAFGVNID